MNTIQWLWNSIEVLMILGVSIIIIGIILFFDYAFVNHWRHFSSLNQ